MVTALTMEEDGLDGHFDEATKIVWVIYPKILAPEVTIKMYTWYDQLAQELGGFSAMKGCIFDFRNVRKFHPQNARTAQVESRKINEKYDLSAFPVAFLVKDMYQEQMLRVSMRITQNSSRLRLVFTEDEGVKFILNWKQEA